MTRACSLVLGLVALALAGPSAAATLGFDASVMRDDFAGLAHFRVGFAEPPDFRTVDAANRPKDSFQFFIDPDNGPSPVNSARVLVRGSEIRFGGIRIRDAAPPVDDPEAGGWGQLRRSVPYVVTGNVVSFIVSYEALGTPSGTFSWQAIRERYGELTGVEVSSTAPAPIPLPPGLLLLATAIASLTGAAGLRRRGVLSGTTPARPSRRPAPDAA